MSLPFSFDEPLVTERLSLRLMNEGDVDAVHDWMSDPEVVRYQLYDVRDRATVAEKVAEYRKLHANPYRAAAALYVDDVIRPSWTRRLLIERLVTLRAKRDQRPQKKHGNIPM